ncbi:glycosyltransferase [Rhodococcus rhodochrous]|nr:glycosyltransferase [Rhodococcus rhodochrous]
MARAVEMIRWDYWEAPRAAHGMGAKAVIHCANVGLPYGTAKSILVVHDVMALDHPHLFDSKYVRYLKMVMPPAMKRAALVVTPSNHSKARILARWPQARVVTVPWALPDVPPAKPRPKQPRERNVLVVSSVDKHKRLDLCVAAVEIAREISGIDFRLTIVGRPGNAELDLQAAQEKYDSDATWVRRLSNVSDEELQNHYESSFCLLISSIDEGFCLPVIEAGVHGLPVVHSGRGALNEVTSARLDLPANSKDDLFVLVEGVLNLIDDNSWKHESENSATIANKYSWHAFVKMWNEITEEVGR